MIIVASETSAITPLLPYITGPAAALVVLFLMVLAIWHEDLVTGKQHKRDLETIARLQGVVDDLSRANETLRTANEASQAQVNRLLDGSTLANTLAQALVSVAQQQLPKPAQNELPAHGD